MKYKELDIESWSRKNAYHFFKDYQDPFFNISASIDITTKLEYCKSQKQSFFLHLLHGALEAANNIEEFKVREKDGKVVIYEVIHCGSTILNEDKSFSFAYFDHDPDVSRFVEKGMTEIERVKLSKSLDPRFGQLNMIHFSSIPWISFSSFKHARKRNIEDTVPKIVFGKYYHDKEQWKLPVSVEVHHAMMDGYHIGLFFNSLERIMMSEKVI